MFRKEQNILNKREKIIKNIKTAGENWKIEWCCVKILGDIKWKCDETNKNCSLDKITMKQLN